MTTFQKRVATTLIGLPVIVILACLPYYNYLAFNVLLFIVSIIASYETSNILDPEKNGLLLPAFLPPLLIPISYLSNIFLNSAFILELIFLLLIITFALEIKRGEKDNFKGSINRLVKTTFLIIYPTAFAASLSNMTFLHSSQFLIGVYLFVVYSSDISAYIFGMLFGKNNRGFLKVSPNKSIVGFIAGILFPALFMGYFATTNIFNLEFYQGFILGAALALGAILGDLIESVLKRCSNVKDSGTVIPGRGGMLDSIDSVIVTLPIYITALNILC